jgi:hypothetical protein
MNEIEKSEQQRNVEGLAERDDRGKKLVVTRTFYWDWDDSLFRMFKKIFCKEEEK